MKPRPSLPVLVAMALPGAALGGSPAWAFSAQGHRWPDADATPMPYMLDPAGSAEAGPGATLGALRRAFAAWEAVGCSHLRFREVPFEAAGAARNVIANDGDHRVFWAETAEAWPGDPGTLALTYTFYTVDARRAITDADIVVNGVTFRWTTVEGEVGEGSPPLVDVETVLFHEIGHFFGLDHSADPAAAMFASNNKPLQRGPARDDVEGICALYSNGEPLPHAPADGRGAPVGAACLGHSNCASGLCVQDPAYPDAPYCTRTCTPGAAALCPSGFDCVASGSQAYCLRPEPIDELCDQCNLHEHCTSGLCVGVPFRNGGAPFCTKSCDPAPGLPSQCPSGYACEITQQQTTQIAVCVPTRGVCEPRGKGGHLEPCFGNGACKPGHGCFEYFSGQGIAFCYALCDARALGRSCGTPRSVCAPVEGLANTAFCAEVARPGEPCLPEQCDATSVCAWPDDAIESATCYQVCPGGEDRECPPNHDCQDAGLAVPVCIPLEGFRVVGESCRSDAECESRVCRVIGETRLCTNTCSTTEAADCGAGLVCVPPTGTSQGLCWPRSLVDGSAAPIDRTPVPVAGYCPCDTTTGCDGGCACDPECDDGCSHVGAPRGAGGSRGSAALALGLGLALLFGRLLGGRSGRLL